MSGRASESGRSEDGWGAGALLSREGVDRRDRMLGDLSRRVRRKGRRRVLVRAGSGAAVLVLVGTIGVLVARGLGGGGGGGENPGAIAHGGTYGPAAGTAGGGSEPGGETGPAIVQASAVRIERVGNDAGIFQRLRAVSGTGGARVERIAEQQVQEELRAAGIEDGLIRVGGRLELARDLVRERTGGAPSAPASLRDETSGSVHG